MNTLKIFGVYTMVFFLFMKTMVAPILFLDYEVRKEYIIKNFCVNKDKPKLHCDGKCYLAKRIKAAEKEEEKQNTQNTLAKLLTSEITATQKIAFENLGSIAAVFITFENHYAYRDNISQSHLAKIFQPPRIFHFRA